MGDRTANSRRTFTNTTGHTVLVFVEPEGWDCWLLPGESVEAVAEARSPGAGFDVEANEWGVTVWPRLDTGMIELWQEDEPVAVGYQRAAWWP